ncbi:MAG: UTP--glucose-1-phosphate uridylyltransferase GalU [Lachnospiraceae bacterium]|nr:UTP--glucose-1-phosphate uridylyltransferase GalU [Lachnospiraceae bacterium]MBP3506346.1 UTP--glucose-1-phosphate uridylyltransferase GalU [Lachnospiraceae bacterium]
MKKKIRKAVIPAAGLGTRFLPATKAIPKEMLPIVDVPTIQYIIKEAVESGIEEILVITNSNKHCMENHFDRSYELEERLKESNKLDEYQIIYDVANMANMYYVRQKEPKGLGHAILCAKSFIGDEPFAVLLGDDIVMNKGGEPAIKQLINAYDQVGATIIGVQEVPHEKVYRYGVIEPTRKITGRRIKLSDLVEKPPVDQAPSDKAIVGRYILTPEIFEVLETQEPGKNGEIQLTDAIRNIMVSQSIYAYEFEGCWYDVGDKLGFLKATITQALEREELREPLMEYLKELTK